MARKVGQMVIYEQQLLGLTLYLQRSPGLWAPFLLWQHVKCLDQVKLREIERQKHTPYWALVLGPKATSELLNYLCRVVIKLVHQQASHAIRFSYASELEYWQLSRRMFSRAKQMQWLIMITKTWNPIISSCILLAPTMVPFYSAPL